VFKGKKQKTELLSLISGQAIYVATYIFQYKGIRTNAIKQK